MGLYTALMEQHDRKSEDAAAPSYLAVSEYGPDILDFACTLEKDFIFQFMVHLDFT